MLQKNLSSEKEKSEAEIEKGIKKAKELMNAQMFKEASRKISKVKKLTTELGSSVYVSKKLKSIEALEKKLYEQWSVYLEKRAEAASKNSKWNDSLKYANESLKKLKGEDISAVKFDKNYKKLTEKARHKIAEKKLKEDTSPKKIAPDYEQGQFDIKKYFKLAEKYKKAEEYEKARDMLEKILVIEPYNYKAIFELKNIYRNVSNAGKKRKYMHIREKLARTQWGYGYVPPIKTKIKKENIIPVNETARETTKLQKKLEEIIIPKIAFDRAPINSVIDFLRDESQKLDEEDNLGINIDLRPSNKKTENKVVTLEMSDVPLGEAIKIICDITDLYHKVEEHAVIISDKTLDTMELKYIPIKSDIINSIADINNIETKESVEIEELEIKPSDEASSISPVEIKDQTIKTYFTERGVPFPGDSAISWDMPSSTLIVKNTPENIKIIEDLLDEIDFSPPLVLIEVKIVELTYNKDKGLAFNFRLNLKDAGWSMNDMDQGSSSINGNDFLNQTGDLLKLLEFSQDPVNIGGAAGAVDFFVYALEQTKIAETLSTPKVVTKSGSTAYFEMIEENNYATSWNVNEPEVVYNTVTIEPPAPNFEEMKMGIVLQVTPSVSPNNRTIFMDIYPTVKNFLGYDDSFSYKAYDLSLSGDTPRFDESLKMPMIANRDLKTKLKINDGETVVLGGMLKDHTDKVKDKYPILGDVPLFGRFFRSEYETVEQKNLLFFVTAKLVHPDGTLLHKPKPNGMFHFKNI
ncbi:MAG: hypothetical protein K9L78_00115 [Victivallales bacterium]|nr:hypothetical protein [Victivallales bacterium]MCF7888500.1 hypothetical protein [Victivallales bacterium]